jgi:hypothetical protein
LKEITQKEKLRAIKIIDRMMGKTEDINRKYAQIKKNTPKPLSKKETKPMIEEIKLPHLHEIKAQARN